MESIIGETPAAGGDVVKDSDIENFEADVIEASKRTPIIVDFWAPWCEPCKQLGPLLEKVARASGGKVKIVKINIDENPQLAQSFRIQSIPAVYAFDKGAPIDGFVGVLPESQIKAFVQRLTGNSGPTPAEQALARAREALESEDYGAASALFGQILGHEAGNLDAVAGLARCYLAAGETDRAGELLEAVADEHADHPEIASAKAALALARQATGAAGDVAALEASLAGDANDHQTRHDLAMALYAAGRREAAVGELLEIVRRDRAWNDEAARKQLVNLFEAFGPTDPLTVETRRKLSTLLFA